MGASNLAGEPQLLRARGRVWPWALTVLLLTAFLLWAGSADPRSLAMWAFTGTNGNRISSGVTIGWLLPAPGLPYFLFASFFLCGALGRLAFAGMACTGMSTRGKILSAFLIFSAALAARLIALHYWQPWTLSPETLAAAKFPPSDIPLRWLGVAADMLTILLLLAAQLRKPPEEGRNLWLAAVYAFHPIALLGVVNGSRWLCVIPLILLAVTFAPRLRRWVQITLIAAVAVTCSILLSRIPVSDIPHPFNGLLPLLLNQLGLDAPQIKPLLLAIGIALEALVLALAIIRRWPVARAWVHMILIWALCSPTIMPLALLPLVALLPLAWSYAAALLSTAALASFGIILSLTKPAPFALPDWLIYITILPVVVLECEELLREALLALRGVFSRKPTPLPAPTA